MRIRQWVAAAVVMVSAVSVNASQQSGSGADRPPKAASPLAGKWTGVMSNGNTDQAVTFEFAVEGTKVIGTFTARSPVPLTGEFKDNALKFSVKTGVRVDQEGSRDQGTGTIEFWATLGADGTLAGGLSPMGLPELPWHAKRATAQR